MSSSINAVNLRIVSPIKKEKSKRTILPKKSLIKLYIKAPEKNSQIKTTTTTTYSFNNKGSDTTAIISKQHNFIKPRLFTLENFESNHIQATSKEYSFTSTTSTLASTQNAKPFNPKKCVKEKKIQEITRLYLDESNKHRQHLGFGGSCFKTDDDNLQDKYNLGDNPFRKKQSIILNHLAKEFFLGEKIYF